MNRKKAILAIFMMAFLIIIGFVFPSIWKSQKGNKKSETENTQHDNNENAETEQAENNESISFQDFEALEDFFSKEQVKLFQEELTSYLKNVKQISLTSIRFLADDTTYPNASDINFLFQLPDKSVLPVYYTSSTGRFFFGEERTPDSGKEIIYERPTDDKLPSITRSLSLNKHLLCQIFGLNTPAVLLFLFRCKLYPAQPLPMPLHTQNLTSVIPPFLFSVSVFHVLNSDNPFGYLHKLIRSLPDPPR